jgi:type VI protein secretion system component VasK
MRIHRTTVLAALLSCVASAPVMAYVGPGAGLTLLSALWGLLVAVLAAVAFLVVWPIRRWRRRRQAALESGTDPGADEAAAPAGMETRRDGLREADQREVVEREAGLKEDAR